jgi:integrase
VAWLSQHADEHPSAFTDVAGAEAAVTAWRHQPIGSRCSAATINQALAAVTLMYEHSAQLRTQVRRARAERPGGPLALTLQQQGAVERAAACRGPRDTAIIAVLLYTGARAEECARLDTQDVTITAPAWEVQLHGNGGEVRAVPCQRSPGTESLPGSCASAASQARCGPASAGG